MSTENEIAEARRARPNLRVAELDDVEWERARRVRLVRYWSGERAAAGR